MEDEIPNDVWPHLHERHVSMLGKTPGSTAQHGFSGFRPPPPHAFAIVLLSCLS